MPANPTSVQEARLALDRRYEAALQGDCDIHAYCESRDALIAAVRAAYAAEIRGMMEGMERYEPDEKPEGGPTMCEHLYGEYLDRRAVLATLSPEAG